MGVRRHNQANSIASLLEGTFSRVAKERILLAHLAKRWGDVVGEGIAKRSQPYSLEETMLCIRADSPAAAQRISMMGACIARKVREEWDLPVSGVRVVVGHISSKSTQKSIERQRRIITPAPNDIAKNLDRVRERVGDPDVALSLARLMALWTRRFGKK
ncbi:MULTISPECIES: DciA family protein [Aminobacterium]|uniref:DciA family protein n=1 Tax=Aminobacterium TaxID=81466 RepID=UPI000467034C|nr:MULTISPECIES: DUF721 domain-containing protein [Aminobacterium]